MNSSVDNTCVLITGGAGFIGSHLIEEIISDVTISRVIAVDNCISGSWENLSHISDSKLETVEIDITDTNSLEQVLLKYDVDIVCHLATSPLVLSLSNPTLVAENIIGMQTSILECQRKGLFRKLITFSTSEVYGVNDSEKLNEASNLNPQTPYAASKAAADLLTIAYGNTFRGVINYTIVRPFNNYGTRKKVLSGAGIIPQTIYAFSHNKPVKLFAGGITSRDYVYVKDTVRAVHLMINRPEIENKIFVIASGTTHQMIDIVQDIAAIMKREPKIEFVGERPGDVLSLCGDGSLLQDELGFSPQTPWLVGLGECIDYYSSHEIDMPLA